jgi:hypothetical protein
MGFLPRCLLMFVRHFQDTKYPHQTACQYSFRSFSKSS